MSGPKAFDASKDAIVVVISCGTEKNAALREVKWGVHKSEATEDDGNGRAMNVV